MSTATKVQGMSVLTKLGLNEEDIIVYNTLVSQPSYISIRKLSEACQLNRGIVYESIKRLVTFGLVSFNRRGERRQYFAERPDRINDLVEKKIKEMNLVKLQAKSLIPRLEATRKRDIGQPQVRFYEHDEGMVSILNDVISTVSKLDNKTYEVYSHKEVRPYVYRQYKGYYQKRIKAGIKEVHVIKVGTGEVLHPEDHIRWLSDPYAQEAACYQIIYGNKVAMISVSPDKTPYGIVIEEKGVATMHRILFRRMWDLLTITT